MMLAKSAQAGFSDFEWASRDPDFASLHEEPEFKRVLEAWRAKK